MGANKTEKAIVRASKAIGKTSAIVNNFDKITEVNNRHVISEALHNQHFKRQTQFSRFSTQTMYLKKFKVESTRHLQN